MVLLGDYPPEGSEISTKAKGISLELLLSSPITWKGSKCCHFFTTAWNWIKEDLSVKDFKDNLNQNSIAETSPWKLWPHDSSWGSVLGEEHLKLLMMRFVSGKVTKDKLDTTSVIDLLRTIRNKHQHNSLYSEEDKQKLNWYQRAEPNGQWQFDENLYANYWMSKFPHLLMYLWWKFRAFRDIKTEKDPEILEFYPIPIRIDKFSDLVMFPTAIEKALKDHLERGMVETRYKIFKEPKTCHLELCMLQNNLLQKILHGSFTMEIEISCNQATNTWHDKTEHGRISTNKTGVQMGSFGEKESDSIKIVICNKISHVDKDIIKDSYYCHKKVVVLTSHDIQNDNKEKTAKGVLLENVAKINNGSILEIPVQWHELSIVAKEFVLSQGKFKICDREVKITDILAESQMPLLSGDVLNNILRGNTCILFEKHFLPKIPDVYIERKLSENVLVGAKTVSETSKSEYFVITNIHINNLSQILQKKSKGRYKKIKIETAANIDSVKEKVERQSPNRIFILEDEEQFRDYVFNKLVADNYKGAVIHFLRYSNLEGHKFQWLGRVGISSGQTSSVFPNEYHRWNENEFLQGIEKTTQIIFIADKPGMGKTVVLASLARKVTSKYKNRFVVFIMLTEFIKHLTSLGKVSRDSIVMTIQHFVTSNDFEKRLVECSLSKNKADNFNGLKFEIMLDGLDEVGLDQTHLVLDALEIMERELYCTRVWVTLRDYLLDVPHKRFQSSGYNLEAFTESKQIEFLKMYWQRKIGNPKGNCILEDLHRFAKKVIKFPLSEVDAKISGIPLQCQMLAEIYESNVLKGNFNLDKDPNHSLGNLYENLIERKLEVYVRDKKGLSMNVPMTDPVFSSVRSQLYFSHVYYALKLVMGDKCSNNFYGRLILTSINNEQLELCVLEQGIIVNIRPLAFSHRTFAEYLVAWFIHQVMTGQLLHIAQNDYAFKSFLWNEILATDSYEEPVRYSGTCHKVLMHRFKFPTVCHFYNIIWKQSALPKFVEFLNESIFELMTLNIDGFYKQYQATPILYAIGQGNNAGILQIIMNSPKHILALFLNKIEAPEFSRLQNFMENCFCFGSEDWPSLQSFDDNRFGILHWLIYGQFRALILPCPFIRAVYRHIVKNDRSALEQKDAKGRTPLLLLLHEGCIKKHEGIIGSIRMDYCFFVEELGANVYATDNYNNTVLHVFPAYTITCNFCLLKFDEFFSSYVDMLKFFVKNSSAGKILGVVNKSGDTPLLSAINFFGYEIVKAIIFFIAGGANFNTKDACGDTPLHIFIKRDYGVNYVRHLIWAGASISVVNRNGQNALHLAMETWNNLTLVKMLVEEFDAELETRDSDGKSVMEYQAADCMHEFLQGKIKALKKHTN